MREYIDILNEYLTEAKTEMVQFRGREFRIWSNPTRREVVEMAKRNELRGVVSEEGDVYIWKAGDSIHLNAVDAILGSGLSANVSLNTSFYVCRVKIVDGQKTGTEDYNSEWLVSGVGKPIGDDVEIFMKSEAAFENTMTVRNFARLYPR
jgi:hypothetical protein